MATARYIPTRHFFHVVLICSGMLFEQTDQECADANAAVYHRAKHENPKHDGVKNFALHLLQPCHGSLNFKLIVAHEGDVDVVNFLVTINVKPAGRAWLVFLWCHI